jgi:competence protein ComEC
LLGSSNKLHRNLKSGQDTCNAPPEFIANATDPCRANMVKLSVAPDGKSYTVSIPGTGQSKTYQTKKP